MMSRLSQIRNGRVNVVHALMMAALLVALAPGVADAYMGQEALTWTANNIIGPFALISIIITLVASFVKPDVVKQAGYTAVLAIVLFVLIRAGGTIIAQLQAG